MSAKYNSDFLSQYCNAHGWEMRPEHMFAKPQRRWRADYAVIEPKVIIEIEGGTWTNGRHTRGSGFAKDMEKYNWASMNGWIVLRYTPAQFRKHEPVANLEYMRNQGVINEH